MLEKQLVIEFFSGPCGRCTVAASCLHTCREYPRIIVSTLRCLVRGKALPLTLQADNTPDEYLGIFSEGSVLIWGQVRSRTPVLVTVFYSF